MRAGRRRSSNASRSTARSWRRRRSPGCRSVARIERGMAAPFGLDGSSQETDRTGRVPAPGLKNAASTWSPNLHRAVARGARVRLRVAGWTTTCSRRIGPAGTRRRSRRPSCGGGPRVVEQRLQVGGVCVQPGTIPSKTLREAVLHLTGLRQRDIYGQATGSRRRSRSRTSAGAPDGGRARDRRRPRPAARNHVDAARRRARGSSTRRRSTSRGDGRIAAVTAARIVIAVGTARRGRPPWPSTAGPCSTRTGSSRSSGSPARCRRRRGGDRARVRVDVRGARTEVTVVDQRPRCSSSATPRSSRRCGTTCATSG